MKGRVFGIDPAQCNGEGLNFREVESIGLEFNLKHDWSLCKAIDAGFYFALIQNVSHVRV